jgi:hypothetical protein
MAVERLAAGRRQDAGEILREERQQLTAGDLGMH